MAQTKKQKARDVLDRSRITLYRAAMLVAAVEEWHDDDEVGVEEIAQQIIHVHRTLFDLGAMLGCNNEVKIQTDLYEKMMA